MASPPRHPEDLAAFAAAIARESDDRQYHAIFEESPVAMHEIDSAGIIRRVNPTECRLLGYERAELLGWPVWELVEGRERVESREAVLRKLASEEELGVIQRTFRRKDGGLIRAEVHENRMRDSRGRCMGIRTILLDVTEKEELAARLVASEQRYRTIVEQMGEGICLVDNQERFEFANTATERILGVAPGSLVGESLRRFVEPSQWAEIEAQIHLRERGLTTSYELVVRRPDGESRTLLVTGSPEVNKDGQRIGTFGILRDISSRKVAEQQLADSEKRFRRVAAGMNDALVLTDKDGLIRYWNRAAQVIFGYSEAEALGERFVDLIVPARYRARYVEMYKRFQYAGESPVSGEIADLLARTKEGRYLPVEVSFSSFSNGESWTAFAVIRDISLRKKAEHQMSKTAKRLEEALARAQDANRAKGEFLASMSHEIRTPMNGIIGMSGLLMDTSLTAEQKFFADAIRRSADALLELINDILDFSKIEARQVTLESIPFDLHDALEEALELVAPKAVDKSLEIGLWFEQGTPRHVVGDPGRLRQIALNLLGNALKFTESGHVFLWVSAEPPEGGKAWFTVEVRDTGIGIDPARLPMLFERFTQADSSTTRKHGGTGLGLAIAKQLTELLGGTIEAESQLGSGSTFRFRVPLELSRASAPELRREELGEKRVLVVDDNQIGRFIVAALCRQWGMQVIEASDADGALAILRHMQATGGKVDIVLVDFMMPRMDGGAFVTALRDDPAWAGIPCVILTSASPSATSAGLRGTRCEAILVKPLKAQVLQDTIVEVLTRAVHPSAGQESPLPLPEDQPAAARFRARALLVEDHHINQKLGVRMLEKLGCTVDVASNGAEAVQISREVPYDIIFMDCQMPVMDGFEATRRIREREAGGPRIPIVAMTASAMRGDQQACLESGMDDYVSKPVFLDKLRNCLKQWVRADDAAPR
jgi:PAS domain S-box-containing protein